MDVNLEIRSLKWFDNQAFLRCGADLLLIYEIDNQWEKMQANCRIIDCHELNEKHGFTVDYAKADFDSLEQAQKACNAHFRELMLKVFLQAV